MNLNHLKYAVEVQKTGSISKAAENLCMNQPNLSRAIKELEESLGINIFKRTSKGIKPTVQGEEFLSYAVDILARVELVEGRYSDAKRFRQQFSVSVPRSGYIADAFRDFMRGIDFDKATEIYYRETNAMRAITNLTQENYHLGVVRYQTVFEPFFHSLFREKGIVGKKIVEFSYKLIMSAKHPLAQAEEIKFSDLADYIQIAYGDPYVPSMSQFDVKREERLEENDKRVYVYDRASKIDLLTDLPDAYMFVSAVPKHRLEEYHLVEKTCVDDLRRYEDVLIYLKEYRFSDLDKAFFAALEKSKNNTFGK